MSHHPPLRQVFLQGAVDGATPITIIPLDIGCTGGGAIIAVVQSNPVYPGAHVQSPVIVSQNPPPLLLLQLVLQVLVTIAGFVYPQVVKLG